MAIGIIDYGMGNLHSVHNAFRYLGVESIISSSKEELSKCDKLILPGVGAFKDAINTLKENEMDEFIKGEVEKGKTLLGICLGMQLLFDKSYEYGEYEGLGLLSGEIVPLEVDLKVPHMGWNSLNFIHKEPLFQGLSDEAYVYFVHSYHLKTEEAIVSATTEYGKSIQISAQKGNVYAVQFHPEKSGEVGLKILENYSKL